MAKSEYPELKKPLRRRYDESKRTRRRSVDSAERAFRIKRLTWGFIAAGYMSLPVGVMLAKGVIGVGGALGMLAVVIGIVYLVSGMLSGGVATMASKIHAPSGESTPRRAEYSRAQSLLMRGQYGDAAVAYEVHCIEAPEVSEPYFRIAEIHEKHLGDPREAIAWYRRALADADLTAGEELRCIQAIADLYVRKLRDPRKAIPELARLVERFPDTPAAEAARTELEAMREALAKESEGLASFTDEILDRLDKRSMEAATKPPEEMERDRVAGALIDADNNLRVAAANLGITVGELEAKMKELRM